MPVLHYFIGAAGDASAGVVRQLAPTEKRSSRRKKQSILLGFMLPKARSTKSK
jgi:hypothetical protein